MASKCGVGPCNPVWEQHGKFDEELIVIPLVDVVLAWTCWMLANVSIVFYIQHPIQNSLHHFSRVFLLLWPSSYICICVHMCVYIQYTILFLFLYSCYYMLLGKWCRKFVLCYLLHVFFGCLFVMLNSVFIADIIVDLENFHAIYFRCFAMCYMLLSFCSHLENVLLCTC